MSKLIARIRRWLGIPTTVIITYKSGAQIRVRADKFSIKCRDNTVTGVTYEGADKYPIFVGFADIESIWEDMRS